MTIRVVVADDQALVRAGLVKLLAGADDITVVGEAGDGREAIDAAANADVVLMDIRMPHLDGIAATARLTARGVRARVLILTTYDLDEYVFRALEAGASGFLLKDTQPDQLAAAIRTVHSGDALLSPAVTRRLISEFVNRRPVPALTAAVGTLTDREREVLELVAEGLSNAEIGARIHLAPATVKSHVSSMLLKLGLRDRVQAVAFAYESGLVAPGRFRNEP